MKSITITKSNREYRVEIERCPFCGSYPDGKIVYDAGYCRAAIECDTCEARSPYVKRVEEDDPSRPNWAWVQEIVYAYNSRVAIESVPSLFWKSQNRRSMVANTELGMYECFLDPESMSWQSVLHEARRNISIWFNAESSLDEAQENCLGHYRENIGNKS